MDDNAVELNICVTKDDAGYGFSITGVTTFEVSKIAENGAAEHAGLRVSDVIRKINGQPPTGSPKVVHHMITASPRVELVIARKVQRCVDGNFSPTDATSYANDQTRINTESETPVVETKDGDHAEETCCSLSSDSQLNLSTAEFHSSETPSPRNIPETLINSNGDEDDTNAHSTKQRLPSLHDDEATPHNGKNPTTDPGSGGVTSTGSTESLADLVTPETRSDVEIRLDLVPSSGSEQQLSIPDSNTFRRLSHDEVARLNVFSQLVQSDEESDDQSSGSPSLVTTSIAPLAQSFPVPRDVRSTHEQCAAFSDYVKLREKPAHFALVLGYAIQNADPTPLFAALVCDLYRSCADSSNVKETKRWATEIYASFLSERAPMRLNVEESLVRAVESTILTVKSDGEPLRQVLQPVAASARDSVARLLREFVGVLARGLGTMYGVQTVLNCESLSKADELRTLETQLTDRIGRLMDDLARVTDRAELQRNLCLLHALLTVAKANGILNGALQTASERYVPFCTKAKRINLKRLAPQVASRPHQFSTMQFTCTASRSAFATCTVCRIALWTPGVQGLQCAQCDSTVHCECARLLADTCSKCPSTLLTGNTVNATGTLTGTLKDTKRPRTVNVISALPNIIRKNLNLPGGATLNREGKRHSVSAPPAEDIGLNLNLNVDLPPPSPSTLTHSASLLYDTIDERDVSMIDGRSATASVPSADSDRTVAHKHSCSEMPTMRSTLGRLAVDSRKALLDKENVKQRSVSSIVRPVLDTDDSTSEFSRLSARSSLAPSLADVELDFALDNDRPLETLLGHELYASLKKRERERQQVIHELITTELSHVRWTIILQRLFHATWPSEFIELRELLLPNLHDVLELHRAFAHALKNARHPETQLVAECGAVLDNWFGESRLADWTTVPARFCAMHFVGIERLRKLRHKEAALDRALSAAEADPLCRRKQLTDLLACEMQRVTKYSLLLERILKPTAALAAEGDVAMATEARHLSNAIESVKRIATAVDTAVRERQNAFVLADLTRRIDDRMSSNDDYYASAVGSLDTLARRRMLFEGTLKWHIAKQRTVDVRCVLLESVLLLFQVVDEKLLLKSHSAAPTGDRLDRFVVSPIVPLQHVHVREDAADKRLFYVLNRDKGHSAMYDLVASSHDERKKWIAYITEAAELVKQQQGSTGMLPPGAAVTKRKTMHALCVDDASNMSTDRRALGRTVTVAAADSKLKYPVVDSSPLAALSSSSLLNIADANADAKDAESTDTPSAALNSGADECNQSTPDSEARSPDADDGFGQSRVSSLRATLRKHNRRGFDDTFLDSLAQETHVNDESLAAANIEHSIPGECSEQHDEQPHSPLRHNTGRRRSSFSSSVFDLHVCNASCMLDGHSELVAASRRQTSLQNADCELSNQPSNTLQTTSEAAEQADTITELSAESDAETESESVRRLRNNDSDAESGTLIGDNVSVSRSSVSSLNAPTRVRREVARDVHMEKHVLRVDEAERIAKQIAKQDRNVLYSLNERQKLLTSFLILQRNLLRVTSLNAEAQRARNKALQGQSLASDSTDEQRTRAVATRKLIENALKQARAVLEFMTTYQPPASDSQSSNSAAEVNTQGLPMYASMPLTDALKTVNGVNDSLLELASLLDGTKQQLESSKLSETLAQPSATVRLADSEQQSAASASSSDGLPFVALSSRNVLFDKTLRTAATPQAKAICSPSATTTASDVETTTEQADQTVSGEQTCIIPQVAADAKSDD